MRLTILLLLALAVTIGNAQSSYSSLSGTITDKTTGKPLAYAHIGIPEQGIGTTTGYDGQFVLKVPDLYRQSNIRVSYIGYRSFSAPFSSLSNPATIKLQAIPTSLQEIIVMDEQRVEDIIRKAVRKIPDNYNTRPTSMLAFYREARTDEHQDYIYLAEGVLDIYKTSYKKEGEGQTGLVQGRQIILQPDAVASHSGFVSGHLAAHRFDFVKYREDFIDEEYFDAYAYRIETITEYEGKPVYVISFDQSGNNSRGRMKGKVYIDTLSYAFLRAEFEIRKEALKKWDDYPLYSGNWKGNRYFVNYRQLPDGKWYFSDALREGHYRDGGLYSNEVVVTEIDEKRGRPVPYESRLSKGGEFLENTGVYDDDFWKQYNTTPLNDELYQSVLQFRTHEIADEVFDSIYLAQLNSQENSIDSVQSETAQAATPILPQQINDTEPKKKLGVRFQWTASTGVHQLETSEADFYIGYQPGESPDAYFEVDEQLSAREYEPIVQFDGQLLIGKKFFVNWGFARGTWDSFYKERGFGVGYQINLTKRRPLFFRTSVQHSKLRYARRIGTAENEVKDYKLDSKKFNSDEVKVFYGHLSHSIKGTAALSLEIHPGLEFFAQASYLLPFKEKIRLRVKEKGQFFNKKVWIPLDDDFLIGREDQLFNKRITINKESIMLTTGVVFKW